LRALCKVRPLSRALVHDIDEKAAHEMADHLGPELKLEITVVPAFEAAVRAADICVTCTPARAPVLSVDWVRPGTFVAGVGADAEHKQELPPDLLRGALVVTDVTAQCAVMGDLHHALAHGTVRLDHVHAELGEVVAGLKPGRTSREQITLFDSTGMAIQDVAAAALVYRAATEAGNSEHFDFTA
jgi:ornithine cyclodeaminase/alanine dehydrogenase-like protein (mu-crystallin family)